MKVKMTIEVEIDDNLYSSRPEEILWLENEVLVGDGNLILHNNDPIGDMVGTITSVKKIKWL